MTEVLFAAAALFAFALVSHRSAISSVTSPMVFTALGILAGPELFGWFDTGLENEGVSILAEATLVLVLFTDAVRIDVGALNRERGFPARLLGIGLPLTLVAGTVVATLVFPSLSLWEAALLAAVLTPTDAALGQAVVSDPRLPVRIRQGINVESGLNDGLMVPVITVLLALAVAEETDQRTGEWVELLARQLGFGVLFGVAVGAGGAWLLDRRMRAGEVEGVWRQLATFAVAAGAFASAEVVEGNGFLAAFTAGLAFGAITSDTSHEVSDFTEDEGELLTSLTFVIFGAELAGPVLADVDGRALLYGVLSLTVVRMAPVFIAFIGSGTTTETRLFAGWFGPRGLASVIFALLVIEELSGPATETIAVTATVTILLSVVAHGLSARPWVAHLSARLRGHPDRDTTGMAEMAEVTEHPIRRRSLWRRMTET